MIWVLILIAIIVMIFYLRKENLESGKNTDDEKTDDKKSKDEKTDDKKTEKETTIIIVDNNKEQRRDPFYTMTDPYWSAYNYRLPGYGFHHMPPVGHRRIW